MNTLSRNPYLLMLLGDCLLALLIGLFVSLCGVGIWFLLTFLATGWPCTEIMQ